MKRKLCFSTKLSIKPEARSVFVDALGAGEGAVASFPLFSRAAPLEQLLRQPPWIPRSTQERSKELRERWDRHARLNRFYEVDVGEHVHPVVFRNGSLANRQRVRDSRVGKQQQLRRRGNGLHSGRHAVGLQQGLCGSPIWKDPRSHQGNIRGFVKMGHLGGLAGTLAQPRVVRVRCSVGELITKVERTLGFLKYQQLEAGLPRLALPFMEQMEMAAVVLQLT